MVSLQLWRRHPSGPFERIHFANTAAYSEILDAWLIPDGRLLAIAEDRLGTNRWQTDAERVQNEARQAQNEAQQARTVAEEARVEAERERAERESLERRLRELEAKLGR